MSYPTGYHALTPVLLVDGASGLIDFLTAAFSASVRMRFSTPDGEVAHSELVIRDSVVMADDASAGAPAHPSTLYLYVDDVDQVYGRALAADATSVALPQDQFYGDRTASIRDAAGNLWTLADHAEDVSQEELLRRMTELGSPSEA
jgi:PhnB protein